MSISVVKRVTSDVDLSASAGALQEVTDLTLGILNGDSIYFEYAIHWDAANNIGFRCGINGPTGTLRVGSIQSNATTAADYSSISSLNTVIFAATAGVNTPDGFALIRGYFTATADGTLQFKACNEGSGAVTIRTDSSALYTYASDLSTRRASKMNSYRERRV